jgi:hypothetical protein
MSCVHESRSLSPVQHRERESGELRVTFAAWSRDCAVTVAAALGHLAGAPAQIRRASLPEHRHHGDGRPRSWTIEARLPAPALGAAMHMMERKLLSLEYRSPGSLFLGWTTTALPAIAERTGAHAETARG